jgi:CBS domain-containing protein
MTLREVARVLDACQVGAAVVRHSEASGFMSERDVVRALANGGDPDVLVAEQVMTRELLEATADTSIIDAARQMLAAGVRHLAVVDDDNVIAVISMRDLFTVLVGETPP